MSQLRKTISARLVAAKQQTAMLTTFNEIDMSEIIRLRTLHKESFEKEHGVRLGFLSFFVKAIVSGLQAFPILHALIEGDDIVQPHHHDIGVAVATEKGLLVPVLRRCNDLSFADIEREIVSFATKAKEGKLTAQEMSGGSFTITNGGVYGSLLSTPILNPPQSAILGMHAIQKRPIAIDDTITIRPMMYLALTYDHRIIDGKEAVLFLVHVKQHLEDPARLLFES